MHEEPTKSFYLKVLTTQIRPQLIIKIMICRKIKISPNISIIDPNKMVSIRNKMEGSKNDSSVIC